MRTLKLTLSYDGTNYVGWQRQTNGMSVQELVEAAFVPLMSRAVERPVASRVRGGRAIEGRGPTVAGAGRTDAGVHALGQVASVTLDLDLAPSAIQQALNVRLPDDIRVVGVVDAKPGFHARHHALGKTYRYRLVTTGVLSPFDRWYAWHAPDARDLEAMRAAAGRLVGTHDFASFQAAGSAVRATVRTLHRLDLVADAGGIVIEVDGNGFLRHMVRAIVGTLADVGSGLRPPESIEAILAARDRAAAGPTAPPAGLTLVSVRYPAVC
jgi:tRNA pseudouridine38-40 synthase